jgi:hypothetical protein
LSDGEYFFDISEYLGNLAQTHFLPKLVTKNGFAAKYYWPISDSDQLLAKSLTIGDDYHMTLSKILGIAPLQKHLNYSFSFGKAGIEIANQPFQMDEIEFKDENGAVIVGHRFLPLAKRQDAYIQPLNFDEKRKSKRDLILREFGQVKG